MSEARYVERLFHWGSAPESPMLGVKFVAKAVVQATPEQKTL